MLDLVQTLGTQLNPALPTSILVCPAVLTGGAYAANEVDRVELCSARNVGPQHHLTGLWQFLHSWGTSNVARIGPSRRQCDTTRASDRHGNLRIKPAEPIPSTREKLDLHRSRDILRLSHADVGLVVVTKALPENAAGNHPSTCDRPSIDMCAVCLAFA